MNYEKPVKSINQKEVIMNNEGAAKLFVAHKNAPRRVTAKMKATLSPPRLGDEVNISDMGRRLIKDKEFFLTDNIFLLAINKLIEFQHIEDPLDAWSETDFLLCALDDMLRSLMRRHPECEQYYLNTINDLRELNWRHQDEGFGLGCRK